MKHLILDCDFLCHRVFHSSQWHPDFPELSPAFLREVERLVEKFDPDRLSFCFDSRRSKRRESFPQYKHKRNDARKEGTREEKRQWRLFCEARAKLRDELTGKGFRNVFIQKGYEADDMIACVVAGMKTKDEAVIVTSDHDMFQLITSNITLYLLGKKKMYGQEDFVLDYGVHPSQWIDIKSIAGCASDNIDGIAGVGEKTAAKYIAGKLKRNSVAFRRIVEKSHLWKRNYALVRLPYDGCSPVRVRKDANWKFKQQLKGIRDGS